MNAPDLGTEGDLGTWGRRGTWGLGDLGTLLFARLAFLPAAGSLRFFGEFVGLE